MRIALRRSDGARVIQLPSGCIPMISECACCAICRMSVLRYGVGHPVARLDATVLLNEALEHGFGLVAQHLRASPRTFDAVTVPRLPTDR